MKLPRVTLRGFRPTARGIKQVLGELEADVISVLWQQPNQTVVEVEERLRRKREIAHTTVLTTLDRMHRKGYLSREKHGKAFVYAPRPVMPPSVRGRVCSRFARPSAESPES